MWIINLELINLMNSGIDYWGHINVITCAYQKIKFAILESEN